MTARNWLLKVCKNWSRRLKASLAPHILRAALWLVFRVCRVHTVIGESQIGELLKKNKPVLPCYWHRHTLFCARYLAGLQQRGLKLGFLVSPSNDGDISSKIINAWGAHSIRGSSSDTGAKALRDVYFAIVREGISITTTPDGPRGPVNQFKHGAILLARLTGVPLLPMSYAVDRAWQLNSWDRFLIPKPFARIVIAIGQPRFVPDALHNDEFGSLQAEMTDTLNALAEKARAALIKGD